ncbi:hypothetical protein HK405_014593, partial [Cladochytrium tenue]
AESASETTSLLSGSTARTAFWWGAARRRSSADEDPAANATSAIASVVATAAGPSSTYAAVDVDEEAGSMTSKMSHRSNYGHDEPHFAGAEIVRDVIVGLSDGLTVPFALAAGLASLGSSRIVVTAGFAEIVAGAISMGLGGYLAGKSEIEHYESEREREFREVAEIPEEEEQEIVDIFAPYGLDRKACEPMLVLLRANPEKWVDFMMKFELSLERPDNSRSWISAVTIGSSYFIGGLVPLIPYIMNDDAVAAFYISIVTTLSVLLAFGYAKAIVLGVRNPVSSAFQMMLIGACAAGVAYGVATALPAQE